MARVLLLATLSCCWLCEAVARGRRDSAAECHYKYMTKTYRQPVDHFSYAESAQFNQRYLINRDHWSGGGPVFFYTGNEGDILLFCENTGFMWEIAPEYGAMVVFAEHRYYGKSLPFGEDSYKSIAQLGYLSSEQALADYANLISYLLLTYGPAPVVVFGGSYGGMLAAWFRIKYPWLAVGAIAASAPIWQFTGLTKCTAPFDIITSDIREISSQCASNVHSSWSAVRDVGSNTAGLQWLTTAFQLCEPLKNTAVLTDWIQNIWFNLAEGNYPYPANFIAPLPAWPLNETCQQFSGLYSSSKLLLTALAGALQVYSNYTGQSKCLNLSQDITPSLGQAGWNFQSCTEMVMPICSNGVTDIFTDSPWNFTAVSEGCRKQYGVTPRPLWVQTSYGGKKITAASNIVFSNGLLDPWSGGGVRQSLSDTLVAVLIPNGAHHLDLRAANPSDPPSVVQARQVERSHITMWIKQFPTP